MSITPEKLAEWKRLLEMERGKREWAGQGMPLPDLAGPWPEIVAALLAAAERGDALRRGIAFLIRQWTKRRTDLGASPVMSPADACAEDLQRLLDGDARGEPAGAPPIAVYAAEADRLRRRLGEVRRALKLYEDGALNLGDVQALAEEGA